MESIFKLTDAKDGYENYLLDNYLESVYFMNSTI